MGKEFIYGAESVLDLLLKRIHETNGMCVECREKVTVLSRTLKEKIIEKKLEKLSLELGF